MSNIVSLLLDLLKIESPTGQELQVNDYIISFGQKLKSFTLTQKGKTLIYNLNNGEKKHRIAFYGHTDTVHNQQDKPPYATENNIYGCGASDMKGGLAVMLQLMDFLNNNSTNFNVQFVFYDGEEGPYTDSGLHKIFESPDPMLKADLALVLEPTNNNIHNGCLGNIQAKLVFLGKSGHSARPWQAHNPIKDALPMMQKIASFQQKEHNIEGLIFTESMNITILQAGHSTNVIPDKLHINLNYRFPPNMTENQALDFIRKFIGNEKLISKIDSAPSGMVISSNPLLDKLIAANSLQIEPKQAWTDVARLTSANIDAVNFGPGDPAQAHQKNEYIPIAQLEKSLLMLTAFLQS